MGSGDTFYCYDYDSVVSLVRIFTAVAIDMIKTVSSFDAKSFHVPMNYVSLIHHRIVLPTKSIFCWGWCEVLKI